MRERAYACECVHTSERKNRNIFPSFCKEEKKSEKICYLKPLLLLIIFISYNYL